MERKNIEDATRAQIAEIMPRAIAAAMESYQLFLDNEKDTGNAKSFKAHHDACKVALGHVALLIKMAQWADVGDESADNHKVLEEMIENAEKELNNKENI